jgi:hypothetical protein
MATGPFQKLSARDQGLPHQQVLHEGAPPHLEAPLRGWITAALAGGGAAQVALRLEIPVMLGDNPISVLALDLNANTLLDVVDAILACGGPWPPLNPGDLERGTNTNYPGLRQLRDNLTAMLEEGSSAWRVNDDRTGLTRRVDPTVADAANSAADSAANTPAAGSAADHLRTAWGGLYQLRPDSSAAYRDAIRAVESAAHAVVEPNNSRATLGTMLGQLRAQPQLYALAIPGPDGMGRIDPLVGMMDLLWSGQTSRHGAQTTTRAETWEEAQMAVHLAVTLVQWFTVGAVRRR